MIKKNKNKTNNYINKHTNIKIKAEKSSKTDSSFQINAHKRQYRAYFEIKK